jgi:NAD dependent epimerase/dehydratase family enzyme
MKLLLVGSTGLVGHHVLDLALADRRVDAVVALVRRDLPEHTKLLTEIVDFEHLPEDTPWWRVDAVICTLGTTLRTAGSKEASSCCTASLMQLWQAHKGPSAITPS